MLKDAGYSDSSSGGDHISDESESDESPKRDKESIVNMQTDIGKHLTKHTPVAEAFGKK